MLRSPQSAESAMLERSARYSVDLAEVALPSTQGEKTPSSRSIEDALPGPCSQVRNVVIPMESDRMPPSKRHSTSKPTARKAESFSGDGMIQEANAASRKATGRHNRADRAKWPNRKVADVDRVNRPDKSWKSCEPWEKLDAP